MSKKDLVQIKGQVEKILGGGRYRVKLDNGHTITAQLSGRMRRFHIRVILGDGVQCGSRPMTQPTVSSPTASPPAGEALPPASARLSDSAISGSATHRDSTRGAAGGSVLLPGRMGR